MAKNRLKTKKIKDKGLHCNLLAKRQLKGQQKTERSSRRFGEDFPLHVLKANTVCSRPKESEGPNLVRMWAAVRIRTGVRQLSSHAVNCRLISSL